ncbi:hypothetical protein GPUN_2479 [Glaciecola punicea ACAM 611]|uniref:Uncharacterized protein n=1 Tax=Glaciecola punicea ACAM 611 TaxID=1121923 RepID=H5TE67_9ALTE|nr:hypothetical protein BAE46_09120 [Glaciecola punicea]GAB56594.1 hypothetical protein GPUN_2479 [Glaciecola punicea ACAM 611]
MLSNFAKASINKRIKIRRKAHVNICKQHRNRQVTTIKYYPFFILLKAHLGLNNGDNSRYFSYFTFALDIIVAVLDI